MDANDNLIIILMLKYARHDALTAEEWNTLQDWWNASPQNMEFAIQFGNEEWVRNAIHDLNSAPERKMWKEITRRVEEMDAAINGVRKILHESFIKRVIRYVFSILQRK